MVDSPKSRLSVGREPWLGRFANPETLSENSAFQVVSCFDPTSDCRVFVVAADTRAPIEAARAALDRLYDAHRDPPHEVIAKAMARDEHATVSFVVFDFPARLDFDGVLRLGLEAGRKAPYK